MKLTPTACAAFSSVSAYFTGSPPDAAASMAMGVTATRLLIIGTPYSFSISQPTLTRFSALRAILSYTLRQESSISCEQQSSREMPMVIVRISKFSSSIICIVSRMSLVFIIVRILSGA